MPGGFGTFDELFESLTLIQTRRIRFFPVVMVGSEYWADMLKWVRERVLPEGMVDPEDMDLIRVIDDPKEVVDHIMNAAPFEEVGGVSQSISG